MHDPGVSLSIWTSLDDFCRRTYLILSAHHLLESSELVWSFFRLSLTLSRYDTGIRKPFDFLKHLQLGRAYGVTVTSTLPYFITLSLSPSTSLRILLPFINHSYISCINFRCDPISLVANLFARSTCNTLSFIFYREPGCSDCFNPPALPSSWIIQPIPL